MKYNVNEKVIIYIFFLEFFVIIGNCKLKLVNLYCIFIKLFNVVICIYINIFKV